MLLRVEASDKLQEILRRHRIVLVAFTGLTCPACQLYRPVLEKLAELVEELPVVEYIVDYDPEPAIQLGILGTPTTVVYLDGEPVEGFIGAVDLPDLAEFIARIVRGRDEKLAAKLERMANEAERTISYIY